MAEPSLDDEELAGSMQLIRFPTSRSLSAAFEVVLDSGTLCSALRDGIFLLVRLTAALDSVSGKQLIPTAIALGCGMLWDATSDDS